VSKRLGISVHRHYIGVQGPGRSQKIDVPRPPTPDDIAALSLDAFDGKGRVDLRL
jgi:hypothetical protein